MANPREIPAFFMGLLKPKTIRYVCISNRGSGSSLNRERRRIVVNSGLPAAD